MQYLTRFFIFIACLVCISCAKSDFEPISNSNDFVYIRPQLERFLQSQPESKREYFLEYDRTAKVLGEYLKLEGTHYYFDISKSEAKKLGVSNEMYEAHSRQVNIVNTTINKNLSRGKDISLPDPQKNRARYLQPEMHTQLEKAYTHEKSRAEVTLYSGQIHSTYTNTGSNKLVFSGSTMPVSKLICKCSPASSVMASHIVIVSTRAILSNDKKSDWKDNWEGGYSDPYCSGKYFTLSVLYPEVKRDDDVSITGWEILITYETDAENGADCNWGLY